MGKVIGFLDKNNEVNISYHTYDFNNFILSPFSESTETIAYNDKTNEEFLKSYYLVKNNPLFYFEDINDYKFYRKEVKRYANNYDLLFNSLRGY